jgi:hypothetical protein
MGACPAVAEVTDRGAPAPAAGSATARAGHLQGADFRSEPGSSDVRAVADWVVGSGDNGLLAFIIVDKVNAKVFLFDSGGRLSGATPALLGVGRGDDSVEGIGQRKLATMKPEERTTPAGRFVAALGHDLEQDVLWIDYEASVSLHRVIVGRADERRGQRLGSPSTLDNRISYGCINVPPEFYDDFVVPAFRGTVGIVYILPETKPAAQVFPIARAPGLPPPGAGRVRPARLNDSRLPASR